MNIHDDYKLSSGGSLGTKQISCTLRNNEFIWIIIKLIYTLLNFVSFAFFFHFSLNRFTLNSHALIDDHKQQKTLCND